MCASFQFSYVYEPCFSHFKYNIRIIQMGAALAELCLLGNNTQHSKVGYIGHRCGRLLY